MRILISSILFYPELIGIGKYSGELAEYLQAAGHEVRVIAAQPYYPNWKVHAGYHSWKYMREDWNGVSIFRSPLWVPKKPSGITRLLLLLSFVVSSFPATLRQAIWKPDVILSVAPSILNAFSTLALSWLCGARTWLHVQDFELDAAFELGILPFQSLFKQLAEKSERWILSRFDRVTTISQRMQERLHEKGVVPAQTGIFPNWVNTKQIYPLSEPDDAFRKKFDIPRDAVVVLYAGNMGQKQGLDSVVAAAAQLQENADIHFVFSGDGVLAAEIRNNLRSLTNTTFIPIQPYKRLNALLNMADIHVLPQRAQAADLVMPSKLSGMLASGKPVVATTHPGTELAQVMAQAGVMVPPEDPLSLAKAIVDLAHDPVKRRSLGQEGVVWVRAHWSQEKVLHDFNEQLQIFSGLMPK